jgi:Skp family chaperone for outer membrane proteins
MKKIFAALVALSALPLVACGRCGGKCSVVTVDVAKVYSNYDRAEQSKEQFQKAVEKAQGEMRTMLDEGIKLAKDLQEIQEKMENSSLSEPARSKFRKQIEEMTEEVRKKEVEVNAFRQQTDRELTERRDEFVSKHIEEIRDVVKSIAQKRGAEIALNTSGIEVLHSDAALDITDTVIRRLNGKK